MSWNKMADLVREIIKDDNSIDFIKSLLTCKNSDYYTGILDNIYINQWGKFAIFHYGKEGRRLKSPDGLLTEARGLVIDLSNGNIVAAPFKKFYNYGELENSTEIDKDTEVIAPIKLDGDMVCFRHYEGEVITSGTVVIDPKYRFSKTAKRFYDNAPIGLHHLIEDYENYTCIFEMITLDNPHIVQYTETDEGLYLIGMRDVRSGKELSYEMVKQIANSYEIKTITIGRYTIKELFEMCKSSSCVNIEGWVIEIDGVKLKLKVDDYVEMGYAVSFDRNVNAIIKATAEGKFDDFIAKVPKGLRTGIEETNRKLLDYMDTMVYLNNKYINYDLQPRQFREYVESLKVPKELIANLKRCYKDKNQNLLKTHPNSYMQMADIETILKFKEELVKRC